jgi:hypothetical protein
VTNQKVCGVLVYSATNELGVRLRLFFVDFKRLMPTMKRRHAACGVEAETILYGSIQQVVGE